MKRSTVARHLREIADQATRWSQLPTDTFETPRLTEVWVGGDIVDKLGEPDHVVAILRFDAPEEELPKIALTRVERAVSFSFRLDKRPMIVRSRPTAVEPSRTTGGADLVRGGRSGGRKPRRSRRS